MIDKFINKIHQGNSLDILRHMPDNSVDCVITSPPYWQLRDYGYHDQWGLEPTYQEYLEHLWSLMDEIYRILKPTGTAWINLGDSYSNSGGSGSKNYYPKHTQFGKSDCKEGKYQPPTPQQENIPNKCLLLIPHRFAIGCIDRGWVMRNDIIWSKPNSMPESVTDRFSKKHEYFFFMVKQQKYYFDLNGIRDRHSKSTVKRFDRGYEGSGNRDYISGPQNHLKKFMNNTKAKAKILALGKNPGSVSDFWHISTKPNSEKHYASFNFELIEKPIVAGCPKDGIVLDPFCGVGTTLIRAFQLGRRIIGIDGSKEYCEIAEKKISKELNQLKIFA